MTTTILFPITKMRAMRDIPLIARILSFNLCTCFLDTQQHIRFPGKELHGWLRTSPIVQEISFSHQSVQLSFFRFPYSEILPMIFRHQVNHTGLAHGRAERTRGGKTKSSGVTTFEAKFAEERKTIRLVRTSSKMLRWKRDSAWVSA